MTKMAELILFRAILGVALCSLRTCICRCGVPGHCYTGFLYDLKEVSARFDYFHLSPLQGSPTSLLNGSY